MEAIAPKSGKSPVGGCRYAEDGLRRWFEQNPLWMWDTEAEAVDAHA
jgi:hypothetical protein